MKKQHSDIKIIRLFSFLLKKRFRDIEISDKIAEYFFKTMGLSALVILFLIFFYLIVNSCSFMFSGSASSLLGFSWKPTSFVKQLFGIIPMLVSTLMITGGALAIAAPVGIIVALLLSEYCSKKTMITVRTVVEIFSSIPSVVIGLIGVTFIAPLFKDIFGWESSFNGYMASLLVGMMALPTIVNISLDSLQVVPKNLKMASLALGASKWETTYKVVLSRASSGILTAIMLGMGRAIGETMIVLMVAGNSVALPSGYSSSLRTMTSTIAIEMGEVGHGSLHYSALFTLGLILFVFTFIINYITDRIIRKRSY